MSVSCRLSFFRHAAPAVPVGLLNPASCRAARCLVACSQADHAIVHTASIANGKLKLQVEQFLPNSAGIGSIVRPTVEQVLDWYIQSEPGRSTLLSMHTHDMTCSSAFLASSYAPSAAAGVPDKWYKQLAASMMKGRRVLDRITQSHTGLRCGPQQLLSLR
jgi:hypothetical protein